MGNWNIGRILTAVAGCAFLATGAIHLTGLDSLEALAADAPEPLAQLSAALWISFSGHCATLGLILIGLAVCLARPPRLVVVSFALAPALDAALQIRYLGFIFPTGILITVAAIVLLAYWLLPPGAPKALPAGPA